MSRTSRRRNKGAIGFVRVRVMAEYYSSGLWLIEPVGSFRHGGIGGKALGLPPELLHGFEEWIETYNGLIEAESFDYAIFNETGRELARELKTFLGVESYVEFVPEDENDGIGDLEVIP